MNQETIRSRPKNLRIWLIFPSSASCFQIQNREVTLLGKINLEGIDGRSEGIQTILNHFYAKLNKDQLVAEQVDLCFVNTLFHKNSEGKLECYMDHRPGFLFYHQSFFKGPVTADHLVNRLSDKMQRWGGGLRDVRLWFHLRENILFTAFKTEDGKITVTAGEVRKILDVHYYVLFQMQTFQSILGGRIQRLTLSGELFRMGELKDFLTENHPEVGIVPIPELFSVHGKWNTAYASFLPEIPE